MSKKMKISIETYEKIKLNKNIIKLQFKKDLIILCRIIDRLKKIYSKEGNLLADF